MRALDLELVRRRPLWPAWAILAIGLALGAEALYSAVKARDVLDALQQRRGRPAISASMAKEPVSEQTQRELDTARQALRELAMPWEALFRAIEGTKEGVKGSSTALLVIEPDAAKQVVRIGGEARDYASILELARRLEAPPVLGDVHLLNHEILEEAAGRPFQFTLSAHWRNAP